MSNCLNFKIMRGQSYLTNVPFVNRRYGFTKIILLTKMVDNMFMNNTPQ